MFKFESAIEPANIAFVIPLALTLNVSELISIELSSTPTAKETELPSETEPPPLKPSPAVTVTALFASFAFAIEPASSSFDTPLSFIVTAPLDTLKLSELNDAIPLFAVVASSPATVSVFEVADVSIPSPPAIVKVSLSKSIAIVPLSELTSKSSAVNCVSTYALILCCVASPVALFELKSSSSKIEVTVVPIAKLSMFAVPSICKSFHSFVLEPKS